MTDIATPGKRPGYQRPTEFPANINIMTTAEQRTKIDEIRAELNVSLGSVVRALIDDGLRTYRRTAPDR